MSAARAILCAGLLAASTTLSGCIAVAIPIAAGAAIVETQRAEVKQDRAAGLVQVASGRTRAKAGPGPAPAPPRAAGAVPESANVVLTGMTEVPPPSGFAAFDRDGVIAAFASHAADQAARDPALTARKGALLADPGLLEPQRIECAMRPPAVLIDLDPGDDTFDPLARHVADPALPAALAELRDNEVAVFWLSRLGTGFEGKLREVLRDTGLDPAGEDRLLLLGSLEERKQTRRAQIAARFCPVAILGDERADFDELFLYLKQPDAALALEPMIGQGWFLRQPLIEVPDVAP